MAKKRKLNLRQTRFLQLYTDPSNKDLFGNATKCYMQVYGSNSNIASAAATRLLGNVSVQSELERLLEKKGYSIEVRLDDLHEIAAGREVRTPKHTTYEYYTDKETGRRRRRVSSLQVAEIPTTNADRIKAILAINKMTGLDEIHRATAAIAIRESKDLYKRIVRPRSAKEKPSVARQGTVKRSSHNSGIQASPKRIEAHNEPLSSDQAYTDSQADPTPVHDQAESQDVQ